MKRLAATLFLMLITSANALGAESPSPEQIAATFFDTLLKGDTSKAVDQFFSSNSALSQRVQQVQLLKSQMATISDIYGKPFAVEPVLVEDLTPSLQRRVYITKHESHPVTWEMYFYKPRDTWLADQLMFVDQYQVLGRKK